MAEYYVKTTGNDSTGDGSEGNPWASPGKAAGEISSGDTVYVQSGTYAMTTATARVAGGLLQINTGSNWIGYQTTPGDNGTPPVITTGVLSNNLTVVSGSTASDRINVINLHVKHTGSGNVIGFGVSNRYWTVDLCIAEDCSTGFNANTSSVTRCLALGCGVGYVNTNASFCTAVECGTGFQSAVTSSVPLWSHCVAWNGTGVGFDCSSTNSFSATGCLAVNNDGDGFATANSMVCDSCIAALNGAYGFKGHTTNTPGVKLIDCASRSNTSGRASSSEVAFDINPIALTADPFTDESIGDFSLNNDAGGGATLRAIMAAMPGVDTDIYPFGTWAAPVGGSSGPARPRQGNLIGRSF